MGKILRFTASETNSYLLIDEEEAAVIDAAVAANVLEKQLRDVSVRYILLTHGHSRHVKFLPELKERFGGEVGIHEHDLRLLHESHPDFEPDILLKHGQRLKVGGLELRVYHTPGHTEGSVCLEVRKLDALFSGDTLLRGAYGRIDGPHSMGKMVISLKMLSRNLPPDATIYPGHGPTTRIEDEVWLDGLDMLS